jgi:hypothetical protein
VLDQLRDPGRVADVGLAAGHVAQVAGVEQPAPQVVLQQLADRLPLHPGRLHPTTWTAKLASQSPSSTSPAVVVRNVRVWVWRVPRRAPPTRTHAVTEPCARPARRTARCGCPSLLLPRPSPTAAWRSLLMKSLGCVLAATVRVPQGSRVPLILGLAGTKPSRPRQATRPPFHAPGWPTKAMTTNSKARGCAPTARAEPGDPDRSLDLVRLTYPREQSRFVRADQYDAHQPADLAVEGPKVVAP